MNNNRWKIVLLTALIIFSMSGCSSINTMSIPTSSQTTQSTSSINQPTSSINQPTSNIIQTTLTSEAITTASETAVPAESTAATENPLATEKNPPGDIPDSQVFVKYTNVAGVYEFSVPEGWARTESGTDVSFIDKFDGVKVRLISFSDPFTLDSIQSKQAADLQKNGRAVTVRSVAEETINGGKAILIRYESNSEPDTVTGKQMRLEDQCFFFYQDGKLAALTLWAPLGADNVDQWKLMSESFKWK
jgi:hypothetical protein